MSGTGSKGLVVDDRFRRKHSLSGVLSCITAGTAFLLWVIGVLAYHYGSTAGVIILAISWSAMLSCCLIGLGLAIHGVIPRRRKKIFPLIGLVANPLIIFICVIYFWWPNADTLVTAVVENDVPTIHRTLRLGVDIEAESTLKNEEVKAGATALSAAGQMGRLDIMKDLIRRGAAIDHPDGSGATPLYQAVAASHTYIVDYLLAHKANPNIPGPGGYPIQVAARQGHQAILELLLSHGAQVNPKGHSPLYEAASLGHNGIARLLIEAGANLNAHDDQGRTPLHAAATNGHVHVLRQLLLRGADIDAVDEQGITALEMALEVDHDTIARVLIEAGASIDIYTAMAMNDLARVKEIVTQKPQVVEMMRKGRTPLHEAVRLNQIETATFLLEHKAPVKAISDDAAKLTSLQLAVLDGREAMARLLIDHGADVNRIMHYQDTVAPPLYFAVIHGDFVIVKLLLEQGADVNALCETPEAAARPLYFAVAANAPKVVQVLLDYNAEIDGRKGSNSPTPLYEAVRRGYLELVVMLMKNEADPLAPVGETTPVGLAESRRNRDPMVYDRILSILKRENSLPATMPAPLLFIK